MSPDKPRSSPSSSLLGLDRGQVISSSGLVVMDKRGNDNSSHSAGCCEGYLLQELA